MDFIFDLITAPFELVAGIVGNSFECMIGCTFLALLSCCILSVLAFTMMA